MSETIVMKFGGAAVATPEHFKNIAEMIIARLASVPRLVVVVSAMGKTTDQLIDLARQVHPTPPQREYDMLISAGERISMSLLAMALCRVGQEAMSFTGSQSGIITCSKHSQAQIIDVKPHRLADCLDQRKIAIVAGFQGVSREKEITTLGRGGSDTSAVALGAALGASQVEFYKDVAGIFDQDPKQCPEAVCLPRLTYGQALDIVSQGARILHPRAIQLAAKNGLPLHVRSFIPSDQDTEGTWVHDADALRRNPPLFEESPINLDKKFI
ncbi:MAG: hypothetical protein ACHQUC_04805 [Chlamydiales bacterium]